MEVTLQVSGLGQVRGGIEAHASELLNLLQRHGHEVRVVDSLSTNYWRSHEGDDVLVCEGIHRLNLLKLKIHGRSRFRIRILFTHGSFFETIHLLKLTTEGYRPNPALIGAKLLFDRLVMRSLLAQFDAIFTLSDAETLDLVNQWPEFASRLHALEQPLTAQEVAHSKQSNLQWSDLKPFVLTVCRVEPRKNLTSAVAALASSGLNYIVVGQDHGGLSPLRKFVRRHEVKNFHYFGVVSDDDRTHLMRDCSVFLLPSFLEGVPFSVLEALQAGAPVVCTENSYLRPMKRVFACRPDPGSIARSVAQAAALGRETDPPSAQTLNSPDALWQSLSPYFNP